MNDTQIALYNELRINQAAKRETLKMIRIELNANLRQMDALKEQYRSILDKLYETSDDLQMCGELIDAIVLQLNPDMP